MTTGTEVALNQKVHEIIKNVGDSNGWMTREELKQTQAKLRALGVFVITTIDKKDDEGPMTDDSGRRFFEVSIHPFVQEIADEDGDPIDDGEWSNAAGGEWSDEFGNELEDYPDDMFRKGWSVSSWVEDADGSEICEVDDEEFPDYETAIARAEELADQYRVRIDHRY